MWRARDARHSCVVSGRAQKTELADAAKKKAGSAAPSSLSRRSCLSHSRTLPPIPPVQAGARFQPFPVLSVRETRPSSARADKRPTTVVDPASLRPCFFSLLSFKKKNTKMRSAAFCGALLLAVAAPALASIHTYDNEFFYSVGDAYIYRGGREGLYASTKEVRVCERVSARKLWGGASRGGGGWGGAPSDARAQGHASLRGRRDGRTSPASWLHDAP